MISNNVEVVNVLATGELGRELSLKELRLDMSDVEYDPEGFPGLVYTPPIKGTLVLYRSGKYTISGVTSESEISEIEKRLVDSLADLGISDISVDHARINNIVCTGDLGRDIDLSNLSVCLGIENVEYEPEQNPFLVYRPEDKNCVMTIASSGKVVITGIIKKEKAKEAFTHFIQRLDSEFF